MNLDNPSAPAPEAEPFGAATAAKLPRRKLGRGTVALLIILRIYVLLAIPIVVYAFIRALNQ